MFTNIDENRMMLKGAYRKLKSFYYYNKNFLVMRKKIAEFEEDREQMANTFDKLANVLLNPHEYKKYINDLLGKVDFYSIPKKFEAEYITSKSIVSNTIPHDKKMKSVNFFINAPLEVHILDSLWTVFLSKMDYDKKVLSYSVYGNTINKSSLFADDKIDFQSRTLFNRYFSNYSNWRNNAFDALDRQYNRKQDSVLISLDIRSYFYSVSFSFDSLNIIFDNHELLDKIKVLTDFIERLYSKYYELIKPYRKDFGAIRKNQYPLPIGLFSSMVLGNFYLSEFDNSILSLPQIKYYGRYVDDLLFVVKRTVDKRESLTEIVNDIFVENGILKQCGSTYQFVGYERLLVQTDKIKILYLDHLESRAIIDIYNDTIKIIPSQMDPLPDDTISLSNFDEVAYTVENFTKEKKIRDIGIVDIDTFKVGKFFSSLPRKYAQIETKQHNEIERYIKQIENFFTGSQGIEYYSNWLNYMYFLVITERNNELHAFVSKAKRLISELKSTSLDRALYNKTATINKRVKNYLTAHLDVCLSVALCINYSFNQNHFYSTVESVKKYRESNMFDHNLVSLPLANYLEYKENVSFCKMTVNEIGEYPDKIENSFKFVWSPRFIHYDELLLLLFYHYHTQNKDCKSYQYEKDGLVSKFAAINHIGYTPFSISNSEDMIHNEYVIRKICMPSVSLQYPTTVNVAIGSINISDENCINACKKAGNCGSLTDKRMFFDILHETYAYLTEKERMPLFLVLPELCFPFCWIAELIRFSKRAQIGIITGFQYMKDENERVYNYIGTILPFVSGKRGYKNAFVYIREKNDYSPIEFEELAKIGYHCKNRECAEYQIFEWNGIRISPMVCYELTDIMARALLKGRCDFITAPVFNPDTTYFSNIIDSASRDLHAFIVQANTSHYGDSRITGPYDRDSKDIFKIKGGENDHVVIGTIAFSKFKHFQNEYYGTFNGRLKKIEAERKKKKPSYPIKDRKKPNLKPLSARFKIK